MRQFLVQGDRQSAVNAYTELVRQMRVQDPKQAIELAFEGIQYIGDDETYLSELAHLYAGLGNILGGQGFVERALFYHSRAIDIYTEFGQTSDQGWRQLDIGTVYYNQEMYDLAEQRYRISLELFSETEDLNGMSVAENNLGLTYQNLGEPEKAIRHFENGLAFRETIGQSHLIGHSLSYLGSANAQMKRYHKALDLFQQAIHLLGQSQDLEIVVNNYMDVADLHSQIGNDEEALAFYERAFEFAKSNQILIKLPAVKTALAIHQGELGEDSTAHKHLSDALLYAKKIGSLRDQGKVYRELHRFHQERGQIELSLDMLNEYTAIQDSLAGVVQAESMTKLEVSRVIAESEAELTRRQHEIEAQKLYRNLTTLGLLISIVFLGGVVHRYRYSKRTSETLRDQQEKIHQQALSLEQAEKDQLQTELDNKHKKLTQKAMSIAQSNDLFLQLEKQLTNAQSGSKDAIKSSLRIIRDEIQSIDEWEEFDRWFSEVNDGFYESLTAICPDLTTREQKICAFLKLKLSTKDIARLTHLSPGSVEQYRIKIRKKFDLDRGVNLTHFVDSI